MDNDDLRRGHPTCHKKFDDATAILVGDALQTLAFQVLSDKKTHTDPVVRCELIRELANSSGINGMVGGQMLDLVAENRKLNLDEIKLLQKLKTAELFKFSCIAGSILTKSNSIKISSFSKSLKGLNWISPYFINPNDELKIMKNLLYYF